MFLKKKFNVDISLEDLISFIAEGKKDRTVIWLPCTRLLLTCRNRRGIQRVFTSGRKGTAAKWQFFVSSAIWKKLRVSQDKLIYLNNNYRWLGLIWTITRFLWLKIRSRRDWPDLMTMSVRLSSVCSNCGMARVGSWFLYHNLAYWEAWLFMRSNYTLRYLTISAMPLCWWWSSQLLTNSSLTRAKIWSKSVAACQPSES